MTTGENIKAAIDCLNLGDMANALIYISQACDDTAKKEYPTAKKISERLKKFLAQNQDIITFCSFGDTFFSEHRIDGVTLEEILYKALRIGLENEGAASISQKIEFVDDIVWSSPAGITRLPVNFVFGCFLAVVGSSINIGEKVPEAYTARIIGNNYKISDLLGQRDYIVRIMKNPGIAVKRDA